MFMSRVLQGNDGGGSRTAWTVALRSAVALGVLLQLVCAAAPASATFDDDDEGYEDVPPGGNVPIPPPYLFPVEGFEWRAENRYSKWVDAWAERDTYKGWTPETYNSEYVVPTSWKLFMMGCQSEGDFRYDLDPKAVPKPATKYRWEWNGNVKEFSEDCNTTLTFPSQGTFYVKMTTKKGSEAPKSWTRAVQVKDSLVVVLGDSSASGEGAPDVPLLSTGIEANADWVDDRCHRSAYAGGAQAAKMLEDSDPKTSVTFISFACSGSSLIDELKDGDIPRGTGITGPYVGIEPTFDLAGNFANMLPAQTEALWRALGGHNGGGKPKRKVDALIVAGGINDVHFADIALNCVLLPFCYAGVTPRTAPDTVDSQFYLDLPQVSLGYDLLKDQLDEYEIVADKKLALEYPGFFHDDDGSQCLVLFDDLLDVVIGLNWFADEIAFANANWAPDLNLEVKKGAERNDFIYVSGINSGFYNHGMCADDRYINTATDAAFKQGDSTGDDYGFISELSSTGTAHPNADGYALYARRIVSHLTDLVENAPPVGVGDKMWASPPLPSLWTNVLANDYDPDPEDTLTVRVDLKPQHGTLDLTPDGWAYYKPNGGYKGPDSFRYAVTDGVHERFVNVPITVEPITVVVAKVLVGSTTPIEGLLGTAVMEGPYQILFDYTIPDVRGELEPIPHEDGIVFAAPDTRRRRGVKVPYTIFSMTPSVTSPDYGRSVRGVLKIRVMKNLR